MEDHTFQPGKPQGIETNETSKDFNTSDPSHHDPTNFRYIVHAINPDAAMGLAIQRGQMEAQSGYQMDESHSPFQGLDKFGKRAYISSSVIDQDHLGTWGGSGFILGIQPENVLVTSPTDAGTIPAKQVDFLQRHKETLSFPELLSETSTRMYNEVVVGGNGEKPPVSITGVFIKYQWDGKDYVPVDKRTAWKVEAFAQMRQPPLPIVEIRLPKTDDFSLKVEDLHDESQTKILKMGRDGKEFSVHFRQFPWDDKPNVINFINANSANYRSMTKKERLLFLEELDKVESGNDITDTMKSLITRARTFLLSEDGIKRDYVDPIDWEAEQTKMRHIEMITKEPPALDLDFQILRDQIKLPKKSDE